ncbi:MAG: CDP-alcohol phosphatidyltransferase family protein [Salibacteraceae bacterium]
MPKLNEVLNSIIKFIPNLLTLINLSFGFIGIVLAFHSELAWAGVMVFVASIFDYFDGFAARLLNAQSEVGKELDSLADMVAFGLLPGLIAYQYLNGIQGIYFVSPLERDLVPHLISMTGFLLTACSALRLAKFNVDTRQSDNFIGLPTPATAIFIASIPILSEWQFRFNMYVAIDEEMLNNLIRINRYDGFEAGMIGLLQNVNFWIVTILVLSYLMVSPLPIISMKLKSLKWEQNKWRFIFIGTALVTIFICFFDVMFSTGWLPWFQFVFIPMIIVDLILVSVVKRIVDGKPKY